MRYVCPSSESKAYENRVCHFTAVSHAGYTMHHFTCSSHVTLPRGMTPRDACAQCNMCFMQRCFSLGSWILTVTSALVDNVLQLQYRVGLQVRSNYCACVQWKQNTARNMSINSRIFASTNVVYLLIFLFYPTDAQLNISNKC